MKLNRLYSFAVFALLAATSSVRAADTNPPPRLTVELRDGSRVVGESVEKYFQLRSVLLGEFKLPVKDIRSLEFIATNSAKLTAVNGDILRAAFLDTKIPVKTGFGKVELTMDSIRKLSVTTFSPGGTCRAGLVALWSGDGDGKDLVGANHAIFTDISYADGKLGRAFVFNGSNSKIKVPASENLDVGKEDGFTIETWINPANLKLQEICEWNLDNGMPTGAAQIGTHLEINESPGDGSLWGNIVDTSGVSHNFHSEPGTIIPNDFQQIAMTYDKSSGKAALYRNGTAVATATLGVFTPQTSFDFFIGTRPSGFFTGIYFQGAMKEMRIYNRALSADEIHGDYEAGIKQ